MRAMSVSAFGSAATPRLGFVVGIMLILAACAQGATDSSDNPLPKNLISDSLASAALHAESSGDFRSAAAHYRTLLERTPQDKRIPLRYARAQARGRATPGSGFSRAARPQRKTFRRDAGRNGQGVPVLGQVAGRRALS